MADKKYVLLKWKDGWQEVIAVEGDTVDFNKYYVIERVEHFGRLVLNRPQGQYPELIVIQRLPMEIERIALVDGDREGNLKQTSTYREGTRLEYNYELQKGQGEFVADVINSIEKALADRGTSAKAVLAMSEPERSQKIGKVARAAHIVGGKSQADLIDFMEGVLRKL